MTVFREASRSTKKDYTTPIRLELIKKGTGEYTLEFPLGNDLCQAIQSKMYTVALAQCLRHPLTKFKANDIQ